MTKLLAKYLLIFFLLLPSAAFSQALKWEKALSRTVEGMVDENTLVNQITFLSDTLCQGRATGTAGASEAAFWICRQFSSCGLLPLSGRWACGFRTPAGYVGHNVAGILPAGKPTDRYVVVGSHYDNLGFIDGKLFAGADSNASGVVTLVNLAKMMASLRILGRSFSANVIFVAFDAKQYSMAGSSAFWQSLYYGRLKDPVSGKIIKTSDLDFMVNIDQIGSSLEPVGGHKDYLIMLGNQTLPAEFRECSTRVNLESESPLEIAYDYYGSRKFTDIFYRLSDQRVFIDNKIPSVFFTSGITMKTNKTSDTVDCIDAPILRRRLAFIFHWLEALLCIS